MKPYCSVPVVCQQVGFEWMCLTTRICLLSAGVVFCIPYTHMNDVRGPDHLGPSTSASAQGDSYELIAALTRVRGILFGEDFQQFLRGGATQRFSLTTYLDLFCYQPPEHR